MVVDAKRGPEGSASATEHVPQEQWRALATELYAAACAHTRARFHVGSHLHKVQNLRGAASDDDPRPVSEALYKFRAAVDFRRTCAKETRVSLTRMP